jgi:hypothetical protein
VVRVAAELDTSSHPVPEIRHEGPAVRQVALAEPRWDELRVGVDHNPRPNVAIAKGAFVFDWDVLLLRVAKAPHLIVRHPYWFSGSLSPGIEIVVKIAKGLDVPAARLFDGIP